MPREFSLCGYRLPAAPSFSIIIASKSGKSLLLERLGQNSIEDGEVIVVRGDRPGKSRNKGVMLSKAEFLVFLDDDAIIDIDVIRRALRHFSDRRVAVVGGPNLTFNPSSVWERASGYVLSSPLGSSTMRWRYKVMKGPVEADERMLTSCNLIVRREAFLEAGGFPEDFFPAEESVLLHKLSKLGYVLVYDPEFVAYHRRRSLLGHVRQVFRYAVGRAKMVMLYPDSFKTIFILPSTGLLTFLTVLLVAWNSLIPLALAASYLLLCVGESLRCCVANRDLRSALPTAILMPLHHLAYGFGFIVGLLSNAASKKTRCLSR